MLTYLAHLLLCAVELFFPKVRTLTREEVGPDWAPPSDYYFTWDRSYRIGQRLRDVLKFDRSAVSFWRKRREAIRDEVKKQKRPIAAN